MTHKMNLCPAMSLCILGLLTFHWVNLRSSIISYVLAYHSSLALNKSSWDKILLKKYSSFIQYDIHPVPCILQCKSRYIQISWAYNTTGLYRDHIWLVGNATGKVWPYMVNRGELCAALLSTFYLALDGITVITVLSHSNLLSVIWNIPLLYKKFTK